MSRVTLESGDVVAATVKRVEAYGVYFESCGRTVLVLIPELAWDRVIEPSKVFAAGDTLPVLIIKYVPEKDIFTGSVRRAKKNNPYLALTQLAPGKSCRARIREIAGGIASAELLDSGALALIQTEQLPEAASIGSIVEGEPSSVDVDRGRVWLENVRVFD